MHELEHIVGEQRRLDILYRLQNSGEAYMMPRFRRHEYGLRLLRDALWAVEHEWQKCAAELITAAHGILEYDVGEEFDL